MRRRPRFSSCGITCGLEEETPRERGKWLLRERVSEDQPRACGENGTHALRRRTRRDQPRTRGEKATAPLCTRLQLGSTPHARGKAGGYFCESIGPGINPARAGKRLHDQQVYHTNIQFSFNCNFYPSTVCATSTTLKLVTSPPLMPSDIDNPDSLIRSPGCFVYLQLRFV